MNGNSVWHMRLHSLSMPCNHVSDGGRVRTGLETVKQLANTTAVLLHARCGVTSCAGLSLPVPRLVYRLQEMTV